MRIEEQDSVLQLTVTPDGSGDFLVAVEARSEGFSGHADGVVVGAAWGVFVPELGILEAKRKGVAANAQQCAAGDVRTLAPERPR